MEDENILQILQRYRRDRRVLLRFILSSTLIKTVILPPGAVSLDDINLDQISVDHVINCVKRSGRLELSEAIRDYHDTINLPQLDATGSNREFFLVTDPNYSGSPPRRQPPPVPAASSDTILSNLTKPEELTVNELEEEDDLEEVIQPSGNDEADITLLLPSLSTGITDDELREIAYEVLLACIGTSGSLGIPSKDRRKERKHRLMKKLGRSKDGSVLTEIDDTSGLGMLEVMRVQMQMSEKIDIQTRKAMLNIGKSGRPLDSLLIPLELLCSISHADFSDTKAYKRWEKRQLKVLEEGLVNFPPPGVESSGDSSNELRKLLEGIDRSESLNEVQRMECLKLLKEVSIRLARIDETNEVCHWADGYPLNVKLYEKLLESVFDILDEGKLAQDVEDILQLLRSTWNVLGISEGTHHTCYSWVLFKQFISTNERGLLKNTIEQLMEIPRKRSLSLRIHRGENNPDNLTFMQAFLLPILRWADNRLSNYHHHFANDPSSLRDIIVISTLIRQILLEEPGSTTSSLPLTDEDQTESYISSSIKTAFMSLLEQVESPSITHNHHPLVLLAERTTELLKKDISFFNPTLCDKHPQPAIVSATLLHKLYWAKLKPFIHSAEQLSEEVASVLHAANTLEQHVIKICSTNSSESYLFRYPIGEKVQTLVMRWVNIQLERILNWVVRAIDQEHWVAISPQQRYGSSIVEVYRIVEETFDQFFELKVSIRKEEISSLLRGIHNAFQVYANLVANLPSKEDIIPPEPSLTRCKRDIGIKAFVKKEFTESKAPDIKIPINNDNNFPPTESLCIRLNTLYYTLTQLNELEESIRQRWIGQENGRTPNFLRDVFEDIRKSINACIDQVSEYTAIKLIFWDLRDPFIESLYKPSISQCRLESIIEPLDVVLNQLCRVIVDPYRDRIVTSLLQASLNGLLRVILNGGPSRVFLVGDAVLLEEDLKVLKEFFISGGDGLPRGTVETMFASLKHVVELMGRETRELIEELKSMGGSERKVDGDASTLLRILCHRNDSEASHFLKKQYKIPTSATSH